MRSDDIHLLKQIRRDPLYLKSVASYLPLSKGQIALVFEIYP